VVELRRAPYVAAATGLREKRMLEPYHPSRKRGRNPSASHRYAISPLRHATAPVKCEALLADMPAAMPGMIQQKAYFE
jgi:hypothetical protein